MKNKIDRRLNLVIPLLDAKKQIRAYAHHSAVSSEVFRKYWKVAGQTMNALYTEGIGLFAPRYAALMLREVAEKHDIWNGPEGVERGFVAELRRLTNVLVIGLKGWEMLPLHDALNMGSIDQDESDEIEGAIVFFTCGSHSHLKAQADQVSGALSLWNAQIESLNCTDFLSSLPISITTASTGVTVAA